MNLAFVVAFKLYLSDVGLFTTMLFNDEDKNYEDIYKKLLSDKLDIVDTDEYQTCASCVLDPLDTTKCSTTDVFTGGGISE